MCQPTILRLKKLLMGSWRQLARYILNDPAQLSEIEVEQDGKRALLRTAPGPTIDPVCRTVAITLAPVCLEGPPIG